MIGCKGRLNVPPRRQFRVVPTTNLDPLPVVTTLGAP